MAAEFTVLNLAVGDIEAVVDDLTPLGVRFEHYSAPGGPQTDEKGIVRGRTLRTGPDIAWFKDPAGNIVAVLNSDGIYG